MQQQILRIIDANINRISEGLRVLEDISRFIIEDEAITRQLKTLRHQLNKLVAETGFHLLETRDAVGDVGADSDIIHDHTNLSSIVRANAKRAQEGIRVLEELSKLPELKAVLPASVLKESRYKIYSIEKILITRLSDHHTKNK
ncbi:MAG: thiamine-phosphate pyrophosphorylase [Chloroflexi bacterium]|nr:thiamine-phosphate pyrophosphorylase [Chloroflexota bacterium]